MRSPKPGPRASGGNLAARRHWASSFAQFVKTKKEAKYLTFAQKGLQHMKDAIRDIDDKTIIDAFQEAWRKSMARIYGEAKRDSINGDRRVEVEREAYPQFDPEIEDGRLARWLVPAGLRRRISRGLVIDIPAERRANPPVPVRTSQRRAPAKSAAVRSRQLRQVREAGAHGRRAYPHTIKLTIGDEP